MGIVGGWVGGLGGNGEMLVKEYKLPVIGWISSGDQMYSIVAVVNNNVLYTWKLLRDYCVLTRKKKVTKQGDN